MLSETGRRNLKLSGNGNECKPLVRGRVVRLPHPLHGGGARRAVDGRRRGRALFSSTFRLNLGAFCGIGGAFGVRYGGD